MHVALLVSLGLIGQQCLSSEKHNFFIPSKNHLLTGIVAAGFGLHFLKTRKSEPTKVQKQVHVHYASKDSKTLVTEPVEWPVKLIYDDNPASRLLLSKTVLYFGKYATQYAGRVANSSDPAVVKAKIKHYETFYKDVLNPQEFHVPTDGFTTFNDWFIRSFKNIEAVRPMNHDFTTIASPADSKLLIIPDISENTWVTIKEEHFNVGTFLGDKELAKTFEHGVMMIFRLAPYDYHRYHYPFSCTVDKEQYIKGAYHSVNPRALNVGCKSLTANKRSYEVLTPVGSLDVPKVAMVQVGATAVASIVNEFMDYQKNQLKDASKIYKKGENTGYFQFGGSTIVLLFPRNSIVPDSQIIENSNNGYETGVKVRETIATWKIPFMPS